MQKRVLQQSTHEFGNIMCSVLADTSLITDSTPQSIKDLSCSCLVFLFKYPLLAEYLKIKDVSSSLSCRRKLFDAVFLSSLFFVISSIFLYFLFIPFCLLTSFPFLAVSLSFIHRESQSVTVWTSFLGRMSG